MRDATSRVAAGIVVAGGTGERFGAPGGKQLAEVGGSPILTYTLRALDAVPAIGLIVLVCHPDRIDAYRDAAVSRADMSTETTLVGGGATRTESVRNGLAAVPAEWAYVVVHDGARPLVEPETVAAVLHALQCEPDTDGMVLAHRSSDTLKEVEGNRVLRTVDRSRLWAVQTPQVFRTSVLRAAYGRTAQSASATDDASLVEEAGHLVRVFEGPRDNIKVTCAEDLAIVESVLRYRGALG